MSEDDSLVAQMVRDGLLTRSQAREHEDRNVLLRAIGTKPEVEVHCPPEPFECCPGDRFLLCTDGLHDLVSEEEIVAVMSLEPDNAAERLIGMARDRGGHDNISVIVAKIRPGTSENPPVIDTREVLVG